MKKALLPFAVLLLLALAACASGDPGPQETPTAEAQEAAGTDDEASEEPAAGVSQEPSSASDSQGEMEADSGDASESTAGDDPEAAATPVTGVLFTYMYAVQLLESELYEDAIPQLNIVVRRLPDLGRGWYYRGMAYRHEGQYDFALEDLNTAIELKPEFGPAYKERGILYTELEENSKAMEDFEKALSLYHSRRDAPHIAETRSLLNQLRGGQ